MKISLIIPLRISDGVFQAKERLLRIISNVPMDCFDILIVDYGTSKEYINSFQGIERAGVKIIRVDCEDKIFSIGHARDVGVQYAENDVVIFNDIDFLANETMYRDIHSEVLTRNLAVNRYDFFCVPVFFLTEKGSNSFVSDFENSSDEDSLNKKYHRELFEQRRGLCEMFVYGSSAIVVNKWHYLAIGGHARTFYGHGAEDYDVLHRLGSYYQKGPKTADYYLNTKNNSVLEYKGFRAYFSLFGIDIFSKGIFFCHLWHPKRDVPGYHQTSRNFSLLHDLMIDFDKNKKQPQPLGSMTLNRRGLLLMKQKSSVFESLREVIPYLGDYLIADDEDFSSVEDFENFWIKNNIDYVILPTPYGREFRLEIFKYLKNSEKKFFVFDRGALPDSWFFDPSGFNYESESYHPEKWNFQISENEKKEISEYIFDLRNGSKTLEENGARITSEGLREKLGIHKKKVLFVPFQRPTDSVIRYFSGPLSGVDEFKEWVAYIADNLPKSEWVILCKQHPLESEKISIDNVITVDAGTNIYDLLDLADSVFLINSGVGLLSLAFDCKVISAGQAFYTHDGLAVGAESKEDALEKIQNGYYPNKETVYKFYKYLTKNFYSFGRSSYRKTKGAEGQNLSIVYKIDFYQIILKNILEKKVSNAVEGISLDAPLFYSFGGRAGIEALIKGTKKNIKINPVPTLPAATVKKETIVVKDNKADVKPVLNAKIAKLRRNPRLFFRDMYFKHFK